MAVVCVSLARLMIKLINAIQNQNMFHPLTMIMMMSMKNNNKKNLKLQNIYAYVSFDIQLLATLLNSPFVLFVFHIFYELFFFWIAEGFETLQSL